MKRKCLKLIFLLKKIMERGWKRQYKASQTKKSQKHAPEISSHATNMKSKQRAACAHSPSTCSQFKSWDQYTKR